MATAKEIIGKKITFFLNNKLVKGEVVKFELPGYLMKGKDIPKGTKIPAMCVKYLRVED